MAESIFDQFEDEDFEDTPETALPSEAPQEQPSIKEALLPSFTAGQQEEPAPKEAGPVKVLGPGAVPSAPSEEVKQLSMQSLRLLGDVLGVGTRIIGAQFNPDEGRSFLQEMADPESGLFKSVRKKISESDQPAFLKAIESIAVSVGEDPFTFVTGVSAIIKGTSKQATKAASKLSTKIGKEVKEKAAIKPELGIPTAKTTELPLTPVEKVVVAGEKVSPALAAKEAKAIAVIKKSPKNVVQEIRKGRTDKISKLLSDSRNDFGFNSINQELLTGELRKGVDVAVGKFKARNKNLYKGINKAADTQVEETSKSIIRKKLSEFQTSPEADDIFKNLEGKQSISAEEFKDFQDAKEFAEAKATLSIADRAADKGLSPPVFNAMQRVLKRMDSPMTFGELQNQRSVIGGLIGDLKSGKVTKVPKDLKALGELNDVMTAAMKDHVSKTLGNPKLADEWLEADRLFAGDIDGFKAAKNLFFKSGGKERNPQEIVDEFAKVPTKKKGTILDSMINFMDESTVKTFRNMYWNDIINKASVKGTFSPADLKKALDKQPPSVFNKIFTQDMKDRIGKVLTESVADDFAKEIKLMPTNPKPFLEKLAATNSTAYRFWAVSRGLGSVAGRGGLSAAKLIAATGTFTMSHWILKGLSGASTTRQIRNASNFLKDVGPQKIGIKFKGFIPAGPAARTALEISKPPDVLEQFEAEEFANE